MASYEEEYERLDRIITADESTEEQRDAAREAIDKLIDQEIAKHFESIRARTAEYAELTRQLATIVDSIQANQLTGAIDRLDGLLTTVAEAAGQGIPKGESSG